MPEDVIMNRSIWQKIGWIIASVLLLNVAWFLYVRHEHTLYSWDYDCYWGICGQFEHYYMTATHIRFVRDVVGSIRDQEYTAEPVVPAAVAIAVGEKLHLFSFSRTAYVMANGNLYLVPALLLMIWLVSVLQHNEFSLHINAIRPAAWFAGALIALLTPAFWLPLLRGYPDGGGIVFCFLVMSLFFYWSQKQRSKMDDMLVWLVIAILLVGLVYFRRWYLYWILWFWISTGMLCLWDAFEQWRGGLRWPAILRRAAVPGGSAIVFIALTFLVSPRFIRELLSYDFAGRYAAFRVSKTISQYFTNTFSSPGIVFILLFLGGLAYGYSIPHLRKLVVFQVVQLVGAVADFGHTQDFGPQHHYLLLAMMLPWATICVAVGLQKFQWRFATCLIPVGILTTTLSFTSLSKAAPATLQPLIGVVDGAPLTRGDLAEWMRLSETMDAILLSHGYGRIYVLGSNTTINSSALLALNRSLNQNFKTPDFVDYSREIDKRDGFPVELLHARYVIVASPIHTVFDPAEQQIVMVPEEEFLEGSGIAGAFDKLPYQFNLDAGVEYTMDGGVKVNDHGGATVYIFRKVRNITMQEVEQLSESLRLVHPDRPYIYNPPAIIN
jgi:hypothetical protein